MAKPPFYYVSNNGYCLVYCKIHNKTIDNQLSNNYPRKCKIKKIFCINYNLILYLTPWKAINLVPSLVSSFELRQNHKSEQTK